MVVKKSAPRSSDLTRSPTWENLGSAIGRQHRAGAAFEDILEVNVAIKLHDLEPYRKHRELLDQTLWLDDPGPYRIIDLGAGYGAMATFWPPGSYVYNVDLPEMLEVQREYLQRVQSEMKCEIELVDFQKVDEAINFDGAYLFSAWALTETTPETWRYYISKAPKLAGIYVIGHERWENLEPWPWKELASKFRHVRMLEWVEGTDAMQLCAVN